MTDLAQRPSSECTLPQLLVRFAGELPEHVAVREKEFGIWQSTTWEGLSERVRAFSLGLREMGLVKGDRVAILGDNRPEWLIAELAAQAALAVSMGIYQDSVAEEVQFLLEFSGARFLVAEDQEQVDKILEVREQLPALERVIYYDPRGLGSYEHELLIGFPEVEELGRKAHESAPNRFEELVLAGNPDDLALLATTSGTTGKPKLAMLSHKNLISMAEKLQATDPMEPGNEFVSFLPLAWIGEQMTSVACGLLVGFTVNFPEEPETTQENICEIGPHMMFAPPRIWENMVSDVQVRMEDSSRFKRAIYDWAMKTGYAWCDREIDRSPAELSTAKAAPMGQRMKRLLAEAVCFVWLKDKLGLRRIKRAYTGGAALGPDVFRFFHAMGVNLKQIYGQTEVSGISCVHRDGAIKSQTVGTPLPDTEIDIAENGEILTRGDAVFQGYYNNEEATKETLTDGWLHTGDAGYFDDDGHLIVIDRAKDVMTLHDGTRFSPQFIENKLKFSPHVREAVVFGGDWPFVTSMITIDFANTGKWAERQQIAYTTFTDLSQKESVYELVREHVERTNADLPDAARIKRFVLLHKELDADDAELTRTRKVRRRFVAERYKEIVDGLYGKADSIALASEITYQDGRTANIETNLRIEDLEPAGAVTAR